MDSYQGTIVAPGLPCDCGAIKGETTPMKPMKLYLVWWVEYGERELCDILITKEKAEAYRNERQAKEFYKTTKYTIDSWEVQE